MRADVCWSWTNCNISTNEKLILNTSIEKIKSIAEIFFCDPLTAIGSESELGWLRESLYYDLI